MATSNQSFPLTSKPANFPAAAVLALQHGFAAAVAQAMLDSQTQLNYTPTRMVSMLAAAPSAVQLAKSLVVSGDFQTGLKHAVRAGRRDLAIEGILLLPNFCVLFTKAELDAAQFRLDHCND